ncbi:hypothetical protein [Rufibacter sp. LB8]|uniref:hypothetical protein n=1 Tax=Rufibacter sp. LB8 TaxID=2777781 RepID=UPI00178C6ACC|nr:hypothetical protein [Rufibacter sp. LB8]
MFSFLRNSIIKKVLWGLMSLYLLNISVDANDPQPNHLPEVLTFNDQESILELVAEQLLGFENVFEEYDDHDPDDNHSKSPVKLLWVAHTVETVGIMPWAPYDRPQNFPSFTACVTAGFQTLVTPPPQV